MTAPPPLVLFTSQFPFGEVTESFLEPEIEILAERFPRILVVPSRRAVGIRRLPENAQLVELDWLDEPTTGARCRALLSSSAGRVAATSVRWDPKLSAYLRSPKVYADHLARSLLKHRCLQRFISTQGLRNSIFYDYWLENTTLALALLRARGRILTAVCRAHRFDVYDDQWPDGAVPFQTAKAEGLDAIFAVSETARRYLSGRLPRFGDKLRLARLGVRDPGLPSTNESQGAPVVMSCARLIARKEVHLIPQVLSALGGRIRWIHVGDGPERERVMQAVAPLGDDVEFDFRGALEPVEIEAIYSRERIDAFLSLSTSEGLPVSMMEAQSHGIPIVARGVGGIPEIVNPRTGVLLAGSATVEEVAVALKTALTPGRYSRKLIYEHFQERFSAPVTYNRFADEILALHESQAQTA